MDAETCSQFDQTDKYLFAIEKPRNAGLTGLLLLLLIATILTYLWHDRLQIIKLLVDYVIYKVTSFVLPRLLKIITFLGIGTTSTNAEPENTEKEVFAYIAKFFETKKVELPADLEMVQRIRNNAIDYDLTELVALIDAHLYQLKYVKLNVGGKVYKVERTKIPIDSTLHKLVTLYANTDADGSVLINRDGSVFEYVLQFLNEAKVDFPNDLSVVKSIDKEATYYGLSGLNILVKPEIKKLLLSDSHVKLNVGGQKFTVAKSTLCKTQSKLKSMIESQLVQIDEGDHILIDRNGRVFEHVIQYLLDGKVNFPNDVSKVEAIQTEANYYNIQGLINACKTQINDRILREQRKQQLQLYRRAVYTVDERKALIAGNESIVFLNLGAIRNGKLKDNFTGCEKCIAETLLNFLQMYEKYPQFVYCHDYTESPDFSFDFYTRGEWVKHLMIYSENKNDKLENISEMIERTVPYILSKLLQLEGHGCYVNPDKKLSILF